MQGLEGRHCFICQTAVEPHMLSFLGVIICGDCEGEIMELAVDQPQYDEVVNAFRLLWQGLLTSSTSHPTTESDTY